MNETTDRNRANFTLPRSSVLATLIVLVAMSAVAIHGHAQESPGPAAPAQQTVRNGGLEMGVKAGFGQLSVNRLEGTWVPFRILLRNIGEPVNGRLVVSVETSSGDKEGRDFVKPVNLPTGSQQFHEIPVHLNSSSRRVAVRVINQSDGNVVAETSLDVERGQSWMVVDIDVGVVDSDSTVLSGITSIPIAKPAGRPPFRPGAQPAGQEQSSTDPEPPAAAVTPPTKSAQNRRRNRSPFSFGPQTPTAQPIVFGPDELPRDFVSYDLLDAVVLGDAPLSQMTEDQAHALRLWVASGGLLILTGATDIPGFRAAGLESLSPVDFHGAVSLPALQQLTDIYGRFESDAAPLIMTASTRPGSRLLLGDADRAIVAENSFGSGVVRFVAINPKLNPYRGWGKELWSDLLLPAAEVRQKQFNSVMAGFRTGRSQGGLQNFLMGMANIKPPSATYFLLFLIAYIVVVGPINYLVLRLLRRLELAWITIPAVVIIFTAVSVTVAQLSRGNESLAVDGALVEVYQPEGIARAAGGLLIMPTSKGTHEIAFTGRNTFVSDVATSTTDPAEIEKRESGLLVRAQMNKWAERTFQTAVMQDKVQPLVTVSISGTSATVKNVSDAKISRAVILKPGGVSEVIDLEPGEQKQININSPEANTFVGWYTTQLASDSEDAKLFSELSNSLDSEIARLEQQPGFFDDVVMASALKSLRRPILLGFSEGSILTFNFPGATKRKSRSLYVVHL
ncbi:MAG TPA: hypothetical protein VFV34_19225 [Blastocatellia bacterium]|nr:hypothetical protein [Blastocatellia bacterium]